MLLASCGSSVNSSTQPGDENDVYSMVVSPTQFTLNAGDWSSITATVELSVPERRAEAGFAAADDQVLLLRRAGHRFLPPEKSAPDSGTVRVPDLHPDEHASHRIRHHHGLPNASARQPNLPTGYVTITAFDATRNVSATAQLSVHERAASISLSAPGYAVQEVVNGKTLTRSCVSQNTQVKYVATPLDASGTPINPALSNVFANDYTWTVGDPNVATVSAYGYVVARNPGVTNVYATLNGTVSVPLTFVTCPPTSIVLASFPFTTIDAAAALHRGRYLDLDTLSKGAEEYLTATLMDINGKTLVTSPLNYITSNPLTGSFQHGAAADLEADGEHLGTLHRHGLLRTAQLAMPRWPTSPPRRNHADHGQTAGFGYPIYSNVIGVTVAGHHRQLGAGHRNDLDQTASLRRTVLVAYDSESLALIQTVELANLPNSLVVAPNGATAYLGSSAGLMVVNLTTYQSTLQTYPIVGGLSTDVITGTSAGSLAGQPLRCALRRGQRLCLSDRHHRNQESPRAIPFPASPP